MALRTCPYCQAYLDKYDGVDYCEDRTHLLKGNYRNHNVNLKINKNIFNYLELIITCENIFMTEVIESKCKNTYRINYDRSYFDNLNQKSYENIKEDFIYRSSVEEII